MQSQRPLFRLWKLASNFISRCWGVALASRDSVIRSFEIVSLLNVSRRNGNRASQARGKCHGGVSATVLYRSRCRYQGAREESGKLYSYWPLHSYWPPSDYCRWGTNFVAHFHLGDFNNNEDKVFTFATGAAVTVYSSGGSHSQKWFYDSQQILRSEREWQLIMCSQIEESVARNESARDTYARIRLFRYNGGEYLCVSLCFWNVRYIVIFQSYVPFSLNGRS